MAWNFDDDTWAITMHKGDTGSKWIGAERESGEQWTEEDRCLFTVTNAAGDVVMQRIYRLDDQWGAGDGWFLMEFHNNDTDQWPTGTYNTEWRYDVNPSWDGTPPEGRCTDALAAGVNMIEGNIVRTVIQSTLTISGVLGDI